MMRSARLGRGVLAGITAIAAVLALTAVTWAATAAGGRATGATLSLPRCAPSDLGVWVAVDYGQGAAGSTFLPLEFTNVGHRTCTLRGFPAVTAIARNGHQLGPAAARSNLIKPRTITLAPGRTAHAVLQYIQAVATNCAIAKQTPAFELKVHPPHRTGANHALFGFETCPGNTVYLRVTAIRGGTLGT
jgi:Domain of unknown function (DUF4232)